MTAPTPDSPYPSQEDQGSPSRQRLTAAEKRSRLLKMRIAGATITDIRKALNYSQTGYYKAYHQAMADLRETAANDRDELRDMEAARLDSYLGKLAPLIDAGDTAAVERAIGISHRRAKLFGLDTPLRLEHTGKDGGPIRTDDARSGILEKLATFVEAAGPGSVSGDALG